MSQRRPWKTWERDSWIMARNMRLSFASAPGMSAPKPKST